MAIPHWQGRVSPVFDVAGSVLVVEIEDGCEQQRWDVVFGVDDPYKRAAQLAQTGADVLICGAISCPLEMAVATAGIEVIAQICGSVDHVLAAYLDGRLWDGEFRMPGCCGRRRRGGGRRRRGRW
ncbi:MAG: NifB/NifX family molybdenum-iron cluster-binding protein [Pirellulales bacterium]|nr:NifB/NifX family molybdenum-iron cluster-binding protein [Pirellulales bacterium]